jgi:membrane fusion protein, copper/silver efflux system
MKTKESKSTRNDRTAIGRHDFVSRRGRWIRIAALILPVLLVATPLSIVTVLETGCAKQEKATARYHCPMHPTYVSDRPGDCPICGMRLVPIQGSDSSAAAQPAEAPTETAAAPASGKILYYRSPMDPRVTSPVPAKDEMGMDFVPVYEEPAATGSEVPGHAPVTVSGEGMKLAGIRTTPAERGVVRRAIRAVGIVRSDERRIHQVTLKSAGYVERLFVGTTGQSVRRGDPILSVYSPDLLSAEWEYLHAHEAAQKLLASNMESVRQDAEELLSASKKRLELLDVPESVIEEIERTGAPQRTVTFPAPVSGYVTAKPVVAGMRVEPGTELYTVTDLSQVWIEADFYEYEAAYLALGQEAVLTFPYDPAVRLTGKVALIYPVLDPASRTIRVRFEADNPDLVLKPGMYANAELQIQSAEGVIVPDNAVLDTGDRQLVFVETAPGRFTPRSVRVGLRGDGQALLLEGVREGESVVVQANFLLDSESRIRAAFSGATQ